MVAPQRINKSMEEFTQVKTDRQLNLPALLGLRAITLAWTIPAGSEVAQDQGDVPVQPATASASDNDISRTELTNFDRWLDDHSRVAQQLQKKTLL